MSRRRRSQQSNPVVAFFQKDPFGVTWFALLLLAVLIAKWWYIAPPQIDAGNCLGCVVAVFMGLSVVITALLSLFWVLWTAKRQLKGIVFVFLIALGVIGCAALVDFLAQELFNRMYVAGLLDWQATDITYLLDDFLHHSAGLYLGVLMIYAMARIALSPQFEHRKYVIPINGIFIVVAGALLYIGIMLY
jgi:hypothetical protein